MGLGQGVSRNFLKNSPDDPLYVEQVGTTPAGGLTDAELRASPVDVEVVGPVAVEGTVQSQDDYAAGELLDDQTGPGVLVFTFSQPVVAFWVAVVGLASDTGVVKVDHYGGTPSASRGIPIPVNQTLPIPEPTTTVRVFVPDNWVVTLWGQRR